MTKIDLEDSKLVKKLYATLDEFKKDMGSELEEIKKDIKQLKEEQNVSPDITKKDVLNAWCQLRVDALTGCTKINTSYLNELKVYISSLNDPVNVSDIPSELKKYIIKGE